VDAASGYGVEYPSDWNRASGSLACRFFDPEPFTVPQNSDFSGTALEVFPQDVGYDEALASLIDTRFSETELREQVSIGSRQAFVLELVSTGEGLEERGTRTYGYLFRGDPGPAVLVRTTAPPGERIRHRDVVDHAASTLSLFAPPRPESSSVLPGALEEKRAAILEAAQAGDFDAVAALADPDRFSYSFGGPFPGGPAAFWRQEAERGQNPLEALAIILQLPYTLATGNYVWPFAYDKTVDTITDYEIELLEALDVTFVGEGYLGWRAGFTPDGRWTFFVAGD
jgi:hypothetical protein